MPNSKELNQEKKMCCRDCSSERTLPEIRKELDGPRNCWRDDCPCHSKEEKNVNSIFARATENIDNGDICSIEIGENTIVRKAIQNDVGKPFVSKDDSGEKKCRCSELSCKLHCLKKHTHKAYTCNICEYKYTPSRESKPQVENTESKEKIVEKCPAKEHPKYCLHSDGTPPHLLSEDCVDTKPEEWEKEFDEKFYFIGTHNKEKDFIAICNNSSISKYDPLIPKKLKSFISNLLTKQMEEIELEYANGRKNEKTMGESRF